MSLKTYRLSLEGYDGGTDTTDHLVYWVNAYNEEDVRVFIDRLGWVLDDSGIDIRSEEPLLFSDGVDFELHPGGTLMAVSTYCLVCYTVARHDPKL